MAQRLVSVWQPFFLHSSNPQAVSAAATEVEELGYARIWFSAGFGHNIPARFRDILDATKHIRVAPGIVGIVSIWHSSPDEVAAFAEDAEPTPADSARSGRQPRRAGGRQRRRLSQAELENGGLPRRGGTAFPSGGFWPRSAPGC